MFTALLDRDAGRFRLAPPGVAVPISRRYDPGTLILETTWVTDTGWLVVHDAMTIGEWEHPDPGRDRPRTDHEADHSLLRVVRCIDGDAEVEMECSPCFDYGSVPARWQVTGFGEAHADGAGIHLELTSDLDLEQDGGLVRGTRALSEGDVAFCAITWEEGSIGGPRSTPEAEERLASTRDFWRDWLRHGSFPDHPWRIHLQRSALVLKGLTYAPTGAIVAAPTTSLPETPGGERNWDYRYSWIRDSTFTLWAMHTLGFEDEAHDFIEFISRIGGENPDLQIMYGIDGETDLEERTLDHLSGYELSRPVRVGNAAVKQRQNDVWGALLDSIYIHTKAVRSIPEARWDLTCKQVEAAIEAWPLPDQGIWEARGAPRHYVSSKLMIWVAVDRGRRLAEKQGDEERTIRWKQIASEVRAEILERGVRDGVFRQHYETDALDASTLLIPLVRFLAPGDRRIRATVAAISDSMVRDGFVLRYLVEETDDGLEGEEGAFLICSFWLVSALSEIGERRAARELCERLLTSAGWLDLFAEEIDPRTGRHLGNFPQAFTHLALINAVSHVIADERRERKDGLTGVFGELRGGA
jgi:GH15 family glucan-1,4-alpha-glucosidase